MSQASEPLLRAQALRIVLVEHHEVLRQGVESMLSAVPSVATVEPFPAVDNDAVAAAATSDVVIVSGDTAPHDADRLTGERSADLPLVILVPSGEPASFDNAMRLPGSAFLMASTLTTKVLGDALHDVRAGGCPMPTALAQHLLRRAHRPAAATTRPPSLTAREREVLELVARGDANKDIAVKLNISRHGAKRHVTNLLMKLNCPNRTQVAALAITQGWVSITDGDADAEAEAMASGDQQS